MALIAPPPILPPSLSPSPSSSPLPYDTPPHFFSFPIIPLVLDNIFDFATLSIILSLLLLSLLSLFFIIHLRLKSRRSHHLQNFNHLWTVRLLLVFFVSLWALNEILRLPTFHRRYLYPLWPDLTLAQQANICKVHVILSLGLFEPGFLLTLLFLINISIKKRNPSVFWAVNSIFILCSPILFMQICFVYFSPFKAHLPAVMHRSFRVVHDVLDKSTVMCMYPLFSCVIFAAFAIAYSLGLLLSCWRVVAFVINKGTRVRINVLVFTVMTALTMQIVFLVLASFLPPSHPAYGGVVLAMFAWVALCSAVGEVIVVIKPITDALAAGGDCCRWSPDVRLRTEVEMELVVDDFR